MTAELKFKKHNGEERLFTIQCDTHTTMSIILARLLQYDDIKANHVKLDEVEKIINPENE